MSEHAWPMGPLVRLDAPQPDGRAVPLDAPQPEIGPAGAVCRCEERQALLEANESHRQQVERLQARVRQLEGAIDEHEAAPGQKEVSDVLLYGVRKTPAG